MRNKNVQICKEGKLDQPVLGAGVIDTVAGTALDMFVHHGLPWMGKKAVDMGRYYGSEALRNPKLQKKAIDYALDKLNPMIQNVGSQALNQLSTKIRPKKNYKQTKLQTLEIYDHQLGQKNGITLYPTENEEKSSVCERGNRASN